MIKIYISSCLIFCTTIIILWNKSQFKYARHKFKGKQFSLQKCFKTFRDKGDFRDLIEKTLNRNSSCNQHIQLREPIGRTGNQLFQIAALFGIAFERDFVPIVKPSIPLLKYFDLPNVSNIKLYNSTMCEPPLPGRFYKCFNNSKINTVRNMTIMGQFQSWRYFKKGEDTIRTILKLKPEYHITAKLFLQNHTKAGFKNICIHVRRGDMALEVSKQIGFAVVGVDFIYKAMNFYENNITKVNFFVLSNDIMWCKKNIKRDVIFSNFKVPGYDLALMALCDHVVVSSGSFGWWGAWLSNATAVYFNGYPRPGSYADARFERKDYYPENWIGLS